MLPALADQNARVDCGTPFAGNCGVNTLMIATLSALFAGAAIAQPPSSAPASQPSDVSASMPCSAPASQPAPPDFWHWPRMTGDWGGARTKLEDAGIRLDVYYVHEYGVNVKGGRNANNAQKHSGTSDIFLTLDFEKLQFIRGGMLLMHARQQFGLNVNPFVGALSDPIDDADDDKSIYIDQLWYQHAFFGRKVQWRIGYLDFQTIVDRNAFANSEDIQFMNTMLDNNNVAAVPLPIGLGTAVFIDPTEWLGFVLGAADGAAQLYRDGFRTTFHDGMDFFGFFQTDLRLKFRSPRGDLPGTYRFGTVYDPRPKAVFEPRPAGVNLPPDMERDDVGFYLSFDQLLYRESPRDMQGLGVFFRYGFRHGEVNRIVHSWSAGFQYLGLIPTRNEDALGVGVYQLSSSDDFRRIRSPLFWGETGGELYYRIQLTPWLAITPDIQYIADPGGLRSARDALVFALRARIAL